MENQAAKRRRQNSMDEDRISQLPQPVLHHILTFLPQNDAVKTCVLSKSWCHLGPTRPNLEFDERSFTGSKEAFLSVLDKTLQRYHDHDLSVRDFLVAMCKNDPDSVLLLKKWIPTIMLNMGVKRFKLKFISEIVDFPTSVVFKSESLQELYLKRCKLTQINSSDGEIHFRHLKRLSLRWVYIGDETFEKIMSSCLLIEYVSLRDCERLRAFKVNMTHKNLKCFIYEPPHARLIEDGPSIKIDAPSVETIKMLSCRAWFNLNSCFKNLKSLHLSHVKLCHESFNIFSRNFPCLEELNLCFCFGITKFQLSSCSIKYLTVEVDTFFEAAIDAKNIRSFEHESDYVPSISFTETLGEWESHIRVLPPEDTSSTRFLKLNELLKALSHSKISLSICDPHLVVPDNYGGFYEPAVIENFSIAADPSSPLVDFLDYLFCIFHPKNIEHFFFVDPTNGLERLCNRITEFMCKILVMEREIRHYFSQHNLEEVSMEASNEDREEWHAVQGTSFSEECVLLANGGTLKIRFRLKWGELSYLPRIN